jgi:outer membrane protein
VAESPPPQGTCAHHKKNELRPSLFQRSCAAALLALSSAGALAVSDPLIDAFSPDGGAGLGLGMRVEQSPYRGIGARVDMVPLYLFEGERFYLHGWRLGLKHDARPGFRWDLFLSHRFEGFPYDKIPTALAGMSGRDPGFDFGIGFRMRTPLGNLYGEGLHDISGVSHGTEYKLGYNFELQFGRLQLRPYATVSHRDAKLNNYYYGVEPHEVTPERAAYLPGSGVNGQVGLSATYDLGDRWNFLAGLTATRWSNGVRKSPITDVPQAQYSTFLGFTYDFTPDHQQWKARGPLLWRAFYGRATDCNLVPVMRLTCNELDAQDTRIASLEIGRPLLTQVNGWPLDFNGYIGVLRHDEKGLAPDSWQVNTYVKALWYGFPWRERVRTRVGFGIGASYAQRVPYVEERDQQRRGRNTSKLLNYLDPSIDVNLGDIVNSRTLRDTWWGFGASHRSGVFGRSSVLGNVDGGSNYIYTYLEWKM